MSDELIKQVEKTETFFYAIAISVKAHWVFTECENEETPQWIADENAEPLLYDDLAILKETVAEFYDELPAEAIVLYRRREVQSVTKDFYLK